MISTKCDANVSNNDQDCTIISEEVDLSSQKKEQTAKRQKVLTSAVWEHFDRIKSETKEGSGGSFGSSVSGEWLGGFQDFVASSNLREHARKSELDEYLKDGLFPMDNETEFDILNWWKLNGPKFPILARMARDILAIPTSSVASESSFSKCRRVITDTRSSLHSESVETIMCVKDWLPDIKVGQSEIVVEDDSSYSEWDADF